MAKVNIVSKIKSLITNGALKGLVRSTNGPMWEKAQKHLFEYNKSIITLSSSALVLSFSIIKIGEIALNKWLLGLSWCLFLLVIAIGILILFISFLYNLASGNIDRLIKHKEWKENMILKPEVELFWNARSLMFWLSVCELLLFLLALSTLILTAFLSI